MRVDTRSLTRDTLTVEVIIVDACDSVPKPGVAEEAGTMGEKTILVVDDDEAVLRACRRGIGRRARLFTVTTPDQARRMVRTQRFDAIVVDYRLGGPETGVDVLRELREAAPKAKILLWSAYASTGIAVAAMKAGADDVRSKPVTLQALQRWLDTGTWDIDDGDLGTTATLERMQYEYVRRVVADCGGNRSAAARSLGVQRLTVRRHLEKRAPRR